MFIQIFISAQLLIFTLSQKTLLSLSSTATYLQESSSCACDFVIGTCDEYCCCDSDCQLITTIVWDIARKCTNQIYSTAYQIPECNRDYQKTSSDLYLGLRIAYNLFKNLGCVTNQNTLATLQNKLINSVDYTTKIDNVITKLSTETIQTSLSDNNFISSTIIPTEPLFKIFRPRSFSDPGCLETQVFVLKTYPVQICQRQLSKSEMDTLVATEFKYSSYKTGTILGLTLTITASYQVIYSDVTKRYQYTLIPTTTIPTDATATYQNLVVGTIYQMNMPEVPIDDNNETKKATSVEVTLFLIDSVTPNADNIFTIPQISGIIYKSTKGEVYDISSKGGYSRGSPLRFKKSLDNTNEEILQSFFIGIQSYNGECSGITQDISSSFDIKFLEDQKVSCLKTSSVSFSISNIYKSVADSLKYVARYGDSGSNNLSTDEWLQVTPCSSTEGMYQFSLQFGYIVFGEKGKERFRINSAQLTCAAQISLDSVDYELRFYVQFVEIPNTWNHFKGPSPQIIGGLPDDILAPFINYG